MMDESQSNDTDAWERHITDIGLSRTAPSETEASGTWPWVYDEIAGDIALPQEAIRPFPRQVPAVWLEQVRRDVERRLEDIEIRDGHGVLGIGGEFTTREVAVEAPQSWYGTLFEGAEVTMACYGMLWIELPAPQAILVHRKITEIMNAFSTHRRQREAALSSARLIESTPDGILLFGLQPEMTDALRGPLNLPPAQPQRRPRGAPRALSDDDYLADTKKYPGSSDSRRAERLEVSRATIARMKQRLSPPAHSAPTK